MLDLRNIQDCYKGKSNEEIVADLETKKSNFSILGSVKEAGKIRRQMMSRVKLDAIDRKLNEHQIKRDTLIEDCQRIWNERIEVAIEVAREEGFLNQFKWEIYQEHRGRFCLTGEWSGKEMPEVQQILCPQSENNYHYCSQLDENTAIQFSDCSANIYFDDPARIVQFIKEWKIKIDLSQLQDDKKNHLDEIKKIDSLIKLVRKSSHR